MAEMRKSNEVHANSFEGGRKSVPVSNERDGCIDIFLGWISGDRSACRMKMVKREST